MRPSSDFVAAIVGRSADAEAAIALAGGHVGERMAWDAGRRGDEEIAAGEVRPRDEVLPSGEVLPRGEVVSASEMTRRGETLAQAGMLPRDEILRAATMLPEAETPASETFGAATVLAIEAEGVDGDTLAVMLPAIVAEAATRDIALVVAFGRDQIDQIAAVMLGGAAVLLCEPGIAERVAAYAIAGRRAGSVADPSAWVREGEAERLRLLNTEVARIAALLAGLVDAPVPDDGAADRRSGFAAEPADDAPITAAELRRVIRARRLRAQFFDGRLLEDPGWDMLLDLFAAELEDSQVSVSSLCIASGVAPTTALRWISRMADAALLVRVPDAGDRRRAFLVLSADASRAMRAYVAAVRRAGLPIV